MRKMIKISGLALLIAALATITTAQLRADALHGVCVSPTPACSDNGTVTPVASSSPNYSFISSPSGDTGNLEIITLIPDNLANASSESFSVSGGSTSPASASLVNPIDWNSGKLDAFLGISANPANPIGAFLSTTQALDAGATGYFVYMADLGTNTLGASSPVLNDGSFDLPKGSAIVAFLNTGTTNSPDWVATAPSGQLSIDPTPPSTVPEPASMLLLGSGLLAIGFLIRRRSHLV
ncbi:MAG TPA: PEP-CTERM sorting domain-containing protein [Terriglobia bacterium]|nr:PEP-CTERM sorting domain-containing protein [Terriglobia bacterium]